MPEDIPAKLHKIGIRERMPEGIITNEEYGLRRGSYIYDGSGIRAGSYKSYRSNAGK